MTFKVLLQYLLPHRALSRVVYWATRWTFAPWKNFLIGQIVRRYQVDMGQAAQPDPFAYQHFNAFFTRKLRPDARRADADPLALLSPAESWGSDEYSPQPPHQLALAALRGQAEPSAAAWAMST